MAFSLYKQNVSSHQLDTKMSPAMNNRYFELIPIKHPNAGNFDIMKITGIANDVPVIKYSTSWEDGPTTIFRKKVDDLADSDFMKMFAAKNQKYQPVIATGPWTQKYPKAGTYLEIPLEFRAYHDGSYNTLNYFDCIKSLFFATSPKTYAFTDTLNTIKLATASAEEIGINTGSLIKDINSSINNLIKANNSGTTGNTIKWNETVEKMVKKIEELRNVTDIEKIKNETGGYDKDKDKDIINIIQGIGALFVIINQITAAETAGCTTFSFKYGNIYTANNYANWVINSWSFKPSMNTLSNNQPIYVDFKINVRTIERLGTEDIRKILI